MQLNKNIKDNIQAAKKLRLPWWGVFCLIFGALPIYWLFDHFGRLNIALPALNCIGMLIFAIAIKWKLRQRVWFWSTMAILTALHVPLIMFVPWTIKWVPAIAIAAIDSGDLIMMLAVLTVAENFMEGRKP